MLDSSYIAAFFDAEGCVPKTNRSIIMTNTNLSILEEIQRYLKKLRVECVIKPRKRQLNRKKTYDLNIYGIYNITQFFKNINLLDTSKKNKIKIALESYKKIPYSDEEKKLMLDMRNNGSSLRVIAKKLNRDHSGIKYSLEKNIK